MTDLTREELASELRLPGGDDFAMRRVRAGEWPCVRYSKRVARFTPDAARPQRERQGQATAGSAGLLRRVRKFVSDALGQAFRRDPSVELHCQGCATRDEEVGHVLPGLFPPSKVRFTIPSELHSRLDHHVGELRVGPETQDNGTPGGQKLQLGHVSPSLSSVGGTSEGSRAGAASRGSRDAAQDGEHA